MNEDTGRGHASTTRPHIALNAHLLSLSHDYRGAGIHRYICGLLMHLPQVDGGFRYTAFVGDGRVRHICSPHLSLRVSRLPTVKPVVRIAWEQFLQPWELARGHVDLVHSMAYALPLVCPARSVVTVHDLSFLLFPEAFNPANRLYLTTFTRLTVRRADALVAVSENTRRDLVRLLGARPERVAVVPNGVDPAFRPLDPEAVARFRRERGLPEAYILFVGTLEPRKNLTTLLRAYARLRQMAQVPHRLVVVGGVGWRYQGVLPLIEELGLRDEVVFAGFVPHQELPWWYGAADLFVFPSLYEGFGFPPLEAMACGTPVVSSNAASLPEVVGDAGRLVSPRDVEELAEGMRRVLLDSTLREEMRARGLARAREYSWERTARETAQAYRRVLADAAGRAGTLTEDAHE